jgi:hypothetical protein
MTSFLHVNYLAIVIATAAAWLFGAAYYGLLGKAWLAALGTTAETIKRDAAGKSRVAQAGPFILSFVAEFVMAYVLYGLMLHLAAWSVRAGVISAMLCWAGFVLTTVMVNNAFPGRKPMLTVIDAGHWLGVLVIMGAILGWIGPR